ncbi:MAG: thiolase, partial [Dehalococcoidia bacterium]
MPSNPSKEAAIVAAAEADEIGYLDDNPKTSMMLHVEAIKNVTRQAGIKISDIEAIASPGVAGSVAEYLGLDPKWIDTTQIGGCSFQVQAQHMLAAINAGIFEIGVITHGEPGWSRRQGAFGGGGFRGMPGGEPDNPGGQFEAPYGPAGAPSAYSHAMTRHMHQWGSTQADFAQIAVTTRDWATLNPRAIMHSKETHPNGGAVTVDDVLNSRLISWPLNLLDCCLVCDHGGAVLIASAEIARGFRTPPVWIAGSGEAMD